jgi:drug/metabolite transporter (DMT)-like permease
MLKRELEKLVLQLATLLSSLVVFYVVHHYVMTDLARIHESDRIFPVELTILALISAALAIDHFRGQSSEGRHTARDALVLLGAFAASMLIYITSLAALYKYVPSSASGLEVSSKSDRGRSPGGTTPKRLSSPASPLVKSGK